jgi:hypothetical protein
MWEIIPDSATSPDFSFPFSAARGMWPIGYLLPQCAVFQFFLALYAQCRCGRSQKAKHIYQFSANGAYSIGVIVQTTSGLSQFFHPPEQPVV